MRTDYTSVTEMPGNKVTMEQLQMIYCRYYTASKFVSGKEVLEVGCGPGLGLGYLAGRAKRVIGGDYTESSLRCAQEHYKGRIELLCLDAHALPFRDSCFDVVLLFEVIFYLAQPDKCLEEFRRVLRKGGVLILCLPNKDLPGFISSSFSIKYFSVPELFDLLGQHYYDVNVFGTFPIATDAIKQRLRLTRLMMGKAFNLLPKGKEIKEFLKERIMGKNLILKNEIEYGIVNDFQLTPLPIDSPDFQYQLLYAIAYAS